MVPQVGKIEEGNTVKIPVAKATIEGNLSMPPAAKGVVLFAHGSGSSRFSPRNQYVAKVLNKAGFATLLIDLLTTEEIGTRKRSKKEAGETATSPQGQETLKPLKRGAFCA